MQPRTVRRAQPSVAVVSFGRLAEEFVSMKDWMSL